MLLGRFAATKDSRVLVGAGIGLDAAAIRLGDRVLVAKTDPITFVADEIGTYALLINANDLATMGAKPKWFLATVLLPAHSTTASSVTHLFGQLHRICRSLHVSLCGGHSEITDAVTRPVVVGCLLGECAPSRIVTAAGARVGDADSAPHSMNWLRQPASVSASRPKGYGSFPRRPSFAPISG